MKCKSGCARVSICGMDIIASVINIDKITKSPLPGGRGDFVCAFDESIMKWDKGPVPVSGLGFS